MLKMVDGMMRHVHVPNAQSQRTRGFHTDIDLLGLPHLAAIVTAFDRPEHLKLCLQSLRLQTVASPVLRVIVADNSPTEAHRRIVAGFGFEYAATKAAPGPASCYYASETVVARLDTEYVWFPSDDNWYAPEWAQRMLQAAKREQWDLVYCDALWDPRLTGHYRVFNAAPQLGRIDKGGFIVRREWITRIGFLGKDDLQNGSDGRFVEAAVRSGCTHGKIPDVMWFHG